MSIQGATTSIIPPTWTSYQTALAVDAMRLLQKHYQGFDWGIDFHDDKVSLGTLSIRIMDIPSDVAYIIRPKDIDRDRLNCVVKGGGVLLEAFGLSRSKPNSGEQWGLKHDAKGVIFADPGAVPDTNPGFEAIKKGYDKLRAS